MASNSSSNTGDASGESTAVTSIERLRAFAAEFERRFEAYLSPTHDVLPDLLEAVRYSALAPGKRIRPYLVIRCCELVGGRRANAWPIAAAVECIHTFSLIHDDLPAMDDDDLRRGRPTCHKQFGEATAILAGDAMVVLAFALLAQHVTKACKVRELVSELTVGTGWSGMIGGQTADIQGESKPTSLSLAEYIHERKTASLFATSCRLGAIAGDGDTDLVDTLGRFGRWLGRAFQISDDLLDVTSDAETLGKETAKDTEAGKQTFPRCVGIEKSRAAARSAVASGIAELTRFGRSADDLRSLAANVVDRNY